MISVLEKEITLRYLKTRKKDGFLNIISIFSFIGISLGVAVLIIVMSVMNGFRTELINKIVGFNAHITVKPYDNYLKQESLNNNELKLMKQISNFPEIMSTALDTLEPQSIANYLQSLASQFHKFYGNCKIITDNKKLSQSRLGLAQSVKIILSSLGVIN